MLCLKMSCKIFCSLLCEKITSMCDKFCTKYCNCIYNCILKPLNRNKCIIIKFLQSKGQKLLTLVDIGTDIRTCYLMYNINPYWYTIMLSAILTPFIVFWASSYNFKNVTNNLQIANKDKSIGSYIYACYLALQSFPVIGIIFTITEIIGFYILDFLLPLIRLFCFDRCKLVSFWIKRLHKFKESDSLEFFTICELFFESIPQVLLQLWIFILYPKTFIDSNGNSYLTSFDISISLGSAFLNIAMNIYRLKVNSSEYGLNITTYIPYFMGSQLDKVISDGISVKNWHVSNRYACNLTKMTFLYQTDIASIIQEKEFSCNNPKRLILPITNKFHYHNNSDIYDCKTNVNDSIKLFTFLGKCMKQGKLNVDIDCDTFNEYSLNEQELNSIKYFLTCNYHSTTFLNDWKKYCNCISRNKLPTIYKHRITKIAFNNRIRSGITEEEKKEFREINLINSVMGMVVNLFDPCSIYITQSKSLIFLNLIAFYADKTTLNTILKFIIILRGDIEVTNCNIEKNKKWKFLRNHHSYIINEVIDMLKLMTNCDELMKELNENVSGKRLPKKEVDNLKWLSDAIINRLWVCPNGLILYSPKMKPRIETFKFPVNNSTLERYECNVCVDLIFNPDTKCYWLCDSYLSTNKPKKNENIMYYKFYDDKDYNSRTLDRGEATQFRLIQISLNNWIIVKRNNKSILSIKGEGNINDYQIKMKLISLKGYIGGYPLHTELYLKKNENLDSILDPIKLEEIIVES